MPAIQPLFDARFRLSKVVALLAALTVVLLSMGRVSPLAHAWLHGSLTGEHACDTSRGCSSEGDPVSTPGSGEHSCAVSLFAQGLLLPSAVDLAPPCAVLLRAPDRTGEQLALVQPRYWHPPTQAPPTA